MPELDQFLSEHDRLTRRFFLSAGAVGAAMLTALPRAARANELAPELSEAIANFSEIADLETLTL